MHPRDFPLFSGAELVCRESVSFQTNEKREEGRFLNSVSEMFR